MTGLAPGDAQGRAGHPLRAENPFQDAIDERSGYYREQEKDWYWKEYGEDINIGGTKIGEGVHRDVVHVEAPAGSAFIYDSRLWHRLAPETNISGKDRAAILCAVTPAWVIPMLERSAFDKAFENSLSKSVLSKRDIRVVEKMVGNGTSFQIQNMNLAKDRKARRQESKL